ncbi:MAG: molybdopterin molybdotransferase MoeA, partial [Proteobacteria bacterium]|nr:molybdopterin molybdotransferase MoeA [Pseudomonadota bacterium]
MATDTITFFKVKTGGQVLADVRSFPPLAAETVSLTRSLGRVLADDVIAPEDVPSFDRSTMDGFAVRASETFGAGDSGPALFDVVGEVPMGVEPTLSLGPGQAVRIWTGGMLPPGADAVVMLEYSRAIDESTVELTRAAAPGEHVIGRGDDVLAGAALLPRGRRLRPQDVGFLAALGLTDVSVRRRPRVAILSSGDEVVPVDHRPGPGQVRDVNSYTLSAQATRCGAEPVMLGLVGDDPEALRQGVARGIEAADVVLLSGGSSVGRRDFTLETFLSFPGAELLVHGVSISPGKPTILVRLGRRSLWGLPGHVTSAMIVFNLFVRPLLLGLSGESRGPDDLRPPVRARLSRNLPSVHGREDYVRVRLERTGDGFLARPILGASGLLSTMVKADGVIRVPLHDEGLMEGEEV